MSSPITSSLPPWTKAPTTGTKYADAQRKLLLVFLPLFCVVLAILIIVIVVWKTGMYKRLRKVRNKGGLSQQRCSQDVGHQHQDNKASLRDDISMASQDYIIAVSPSEDSPHIYETLSGYSGQAIHGRQESYNVHSRATLAGLTDYLEPTSAYINQTPYQSQQLSLEKRKISFKRDQSTVNTVTENVSHHYVSLVEANKQTQTNI